MNNYKKISNNSIIKFLGSPNIFVFAIAWMIVLVVVGTLDQSNIGLYLSKEKYFFRKLGSEWVCTARACSRAKSIPLVYSDFKPRCSDLHWTKRRG